MMARLLIMDNEAAIVFALSEYFTCCGWEVDCAGGLLEAEMHVDERDCTAAIIDLCLTGSDSTEGLTLRFSELEDELRRLVGHEA
jgi:DNA-binding response OmpR family regulator